jgi:hypothetical protein
MEPATILDERMMFSFRPVALAVFAFFCWQTSEMTRPAFSAISPEASGSGARIEVSASVYDFGTVDADIIKSVTHAFLFRNTGIQDLILTKVEPHCGCTTAIPSATSFAPGAEGTLTAELRTRGRNGPQAVKVELQTNDPTRPKTILRFDGHILTPWYVEPSVLDLGALVSGTTAAAEVVVGSECFPERQAHRVLQVRSAHPSVNAVTADIVLAGTQEGDWDFCVIKRTIRVEVSAGEELGLHQTDLQVFTDDPRNTTLELAIRWEVEGDLVALPRQIFVSKTKGLQKKSPLQILSRKGVSFEVLSVETKPRQGVRDVLKLVPAKNSTSCNKLYKVEVSDRMRNPGKTTNHLGEIVFKTTHPEGEEISIPYTAIIRD